MFSDHDQLYPEVGAGGFSHVDGTMEFYQRINSLLRPEMKVLDYGAGRGKRAIDDHVVYRRELSTLRGKVAHVIGADIDDIVLSNPSLDEALLLVPGHRLALEDESIDLVVSDFTFEHVTNPEFTTQELGRVLKPGGWICARTPNRWGYIGLSAQLVPNRLHVAFLRRAQPDKEAHDTFPTAYRLNTLTTIDRYFPTPDFRSYSYSMDNEPAYFGRSSALARAVKLSYRVTPSSLSSMLYIFLQKAT